MRQAVPVAVALHVEAYDAGDVDEGVVLLEGDGGRTAGSAHGEVGLAAASGRSSFHGSQLARWSSNFCRFAGPPLQFHSHLWQ